MDRCLLISWCTRGFLEVPLPLKHLLPPSISRDASKFLLAPFSLSVDAAYVISVTVTSSISFKASTATVSVMMVVVMPSDIVATIQGGSTRAVRLYIPFSMDASSSCDPDQVDRSFQHLQFMWSCFQMGPYFGVSCQLGFPSSEMSSVVLPGRV